MASISTIQRLADQIHTLTKSLIDECIVSGQQHPAFDTPTWGSLTTKLKDSTDELLSLVRGPKAFFRDLQLSHYDLAAFQVALEFQFFYHVPLDGEIPLSQLAQRAGMDEDRVGRVMRLLAMQRVFKEEREDNFTHTPASALMATDSSFQAAVAVQMNEMYQAASDTADAIRKSPLKSIPNVTPFSTRFGVSIYDYYQKYPEKAARFGRAMKGATALDDESMVSLRDCYPWKTLGNGRIVDVAGGAGHVSMFLAKQFPNLSFIVQDLFPPMTIGPNNQIADRVHFHKHDIFERQPVENADAYFMKHCLHNHNDADCIKILRALVPALEKAGPMSPLLINEGIIPAQGVEMPRHQELTLRRGDMCMLVTLSAKERSQKELQKLLTDADPRFEIVTIHGTAVTRLVEVRLLPST